MSDYIKREDAIRKIVNKAVTEQLDSESIAKVIRILTDIDKTDVRDDATAHKLVGGGERDGATCWFECDNCGLAVDIGDVFCKHCGARFVP